MGVMPGYRQVTLYIDPQIYEQASHVAKMVGEPVYLFINKALTESIKQRTTPEQRKAIEILTSSTGAKKHDDGTSAGETTSKKRKDSRKSRSSR